MSARILITDDDTVTCRLFVKVLGGEGYEVDWVQTRVRSGLASFVRKGK